MEVRGKPFFTFCTSEPASFQQASLCQSKGLIPGIAFTRLFLAFNLLAYYCLFLCLFLAPAQLAVGCAGPLPGLETAEQRRRSNPGSPWDSPDRGSIESANLVKHRSAASLREDRVRESGAPCRLSSPGWITSCCNASKRRSKEGMALSPS